MSEILVIGPSWLPSAASLAVLVLLTLLVGVLKRAAARQGVRPYDHPRKLFDELCRAHGLDRPSRRVLWRLSRSVGLKHPASLFVDPRRFDAGQIPPAMRRHEARLTELRQKLFGEQSSSARST